MMLPPGLGVRRLFPDDAVRIHVRLVERQYTTKGGGLGLTMSIANADEIDRALQELAALHDRRAAERDDSNRL